MRPRFQALSARASAAPLSILESTSCIHVSLIAVPNIICRFPHSFFRPCPQISSADAHLRLKKLLLADPSKPLPPLTGPASDNQALKCMQMSLLLPSQNLTDMRLLALQIDPTTSGIRWRAWLTSATLTPAAAPPCSACPMPPATSSPSRTAPTRKSVFLLFRCQALHFSGFSLVF